MHRPTCYIIKTLGFVLKTGSTFHMKETDNYNISYISRIIKTQRLFCNSSVLKGTKSMLHLKIKNQHFRIIDIYHIKIFGFKLVADFNPYPFNGIYLLILEGPISSESPPSQYLQPYVANSSKQHTHATSGCLKEGSRKKDCGHKTAT